MAAILLSILYLSGATESLLNQSASGSFVLERESFWNGNSNVKLSQWTQLDATKSNH